MTHLRNQKVPEVLVPIVQRVIQPGLEAVSAQSQQQNQSIMVGAKIIKSLEEQVLHLNSRIDELSTRISGPVEMVVPQKSLVEHEQRAKCEVNNIEIQRHLDLRKNSMIISRAESYYLALVYLARWLQVLL